MKRMTFCTALALGSLTACIASAPCAAQDAADAGTPANPHMLSVTGHAELKGQPDQAQVDLGVVTSGKSAAAAARANADEAATVGSAITQLGVMKKDIQTTNYSVQPVTTRETPTQPARIAGYTVSNNLRVTVQDLTKLSAIIDGATAAGANSVKGISFSLKNQAALHDAAVTAAVMDARRQANLVCAAANIRIVATLSANISASGQPQPMGMGGFGGGGFDARTPIEPGQISVGVDVQLTYIIADMPRKQ